MQQSDKLLPKEYTVWSQLELLRLWWSILICQVDVVMIYFVTTIVDNNRNGKWILTARRRITIIMACEVKSKLCKNGNCC